MWVWLQQEGEDDEEAAIRVFAEGIFVSDLLVAAAPLFTFGGTSAVPLRASQLQLISSSGEPLSNRQELTATAEEGATLRLRPRPHHCAVTPAGSEKRQRPATGRFNAHTFASRERVEHKAEHKGSGGWNSALQFGSSAGPQLPAHHMAALRSRTQEFGPPPGASRPTAASQLKAKEARQHEKQDDKPRWSATTKVERSPGTSASGSSAGAVPPPKPKLPSFAGQKTKTASSTPSESCLSPEPASASANAAAPAGGGSSAPQRDWLADFDLFYEIHNPEKKQGVNDLLVKYSGEESSLWTMMLQKYGLTEDNWREVPKQGKAEPPPAETAEQPPAAADTGKEEEQEVY
eukprot:Hpha_TRINITY_DN216_c0_g1::TRINITY_DN216_c0_g1_i1::g.83643::m.83643